MIRRGRLVYFYLVFVFLWYTGVTLAVKFLSLSAIEGIGLGTAGGVFLSAFKDMWQFLWRKAGPGEENTSPTSTPP